MSNPANARVPTVKTVTAVTTVTTGQAEAAKTNGEIMFKGRAVVLCGVTILVWAWVDSIIWRIMFEPHQAALRDVYGQAWLDVYHWGWADMLTGMIGIGMIGLWPDRARMAWYAVSTWLMANSGLEDVLYYALAGMPIPDRLAWLDGKYWAVGPVTPEVLGVSIMAHGVVCVGIWVGIGMIRRRRILDFRMRNADLNSNSTGF